MSWQDRDYYRKQGGFGGGFGGSGMRMQFPRPTQYTKYLLIINTAIFVISLLFGFKPHLEDIFALPGAMGLQTLLRPWQLITYQFLHGSTMHLFFNMLGLYFLGPPLERLWGSKKFLTFYLTCGVGGGLAFVILSTMFGDPIPIIGASGAILGLLAACAILFPQMTIIMLLFPVPIRVAATILVAIYSLKILDTHDLADACHLAGMITAYIYIKAAPSWKQFTEKQHSAKWEKISREEKDNQKEVDRILDKVHRQGIQSLTRSEKKTLQDATNRQQQYDNF